MSWTDPIPQHYPAHEPDGVKKLIGAVQRTAQQARDSTKNILRTAGLFVSENGMRVESAMIVNGDFASTGSADITGTTHIGGSTDIDGTLNVDANATFGGSVVISGDLAVPSGSITNDALANPILPEPISGTGSGFATAASTWETKASDTLVTPAGFTRALVIANSGMTLTNTTGLAGRSFVARTVIGASAGFQVRVSNIDVSMIASTGANHTALISGLTEGATFTVGTQVFTNAAWPGDSNNQAGVNGVVLWLR